MKKVTLLLVFLLSLQYASALNCVDLSENLFRYDENDKVKLLQDFLYEKGYLKAAPNGYFGMGTFAAIKEYQSANNITPTGVVGPVTRAAVKSASCLAQGITQSNVAPQKTTTQQVAVATSSQLGVSIPKSIVCTEIKEGLRVGNESPSVLSLQNFLYVKGYLKAVPNGYFGPGTYAALTAYQKERGILQTGTAGPLTRTSIQLDSCGGTTASVKPTAPPPVATKATSTPSVPAKATTTTSVAQSQPIPTVTTLSDNDKRWRDAEILLRSIHRYFVDSRGVWPLGSTSTTPTELCVSPRITQMASSSEVLVLATPESPCKGYVDIAYLSPSIITTIPRDPKYATSSNLTGYTIVRSEFNDIIIAPKNIDNKATIKVRCNFDAGCTTITKITGEEFGIPFVTTLSRTILLKEALPKVGITVTGRNFASATNTVILQSKDNQRVYTLGSFPSTDGKTFVISATTTTDEIVCGAGCKEKLPIGEYSLQVVTPGGVSNFAYITIKGFTTSSISARSDSTVLASSTNIKLGTITVSTGLPGTLKTLTLRATSTSSKLPGKIKNFKLKDPISGKTINASGLTFNLSDTSLPENNSRFYDLYADTGDVLVDEAGYIVYGGDFTLYDTLGKAEVLLPIKEIAFSVSPL